MGYHTLAVDIDPAAEGFAYADEFLVQSAHDADRLIERLDADEWGARLRGVVTGAARGCITTAARVAEHFKLRGISSSMAELSQSKSRLDERLNADRLINIYTHPIGLTDALPLPYVIKWEGSSGGSGVHIVRDEETLGQIRACMPESGVVIVERYVQGRHLGILGLADGQSRKIYGIAEKFLHANLTLDKVVYPAALDEMTMRQVREYCAEILESLGMDFGPFQLEMILPPEGNPFFVELEPSILGSYLSELLVPMTSTENMIMDSVRLACEGAFQPQAYEPTHYAVLKYHYAETRGRFQSIRVEKPDHRIQVRPYLKGGETIQTEQMYVCNSFATGKDLDDLLELIESQHITMDILQ